ncbi:hypothetical protein QUC31_005856 [Theobroma cacao]
MVLEVALAVGGAFLSSFLSVLFEKMASPQFLNLLKQQKLKRDLWQNLEILLLTVDKVLADAEDKQIKNPSVKKWLDMLKDAAYDAEDLLDAIATEDKRGRLDRDKKVQFNARLEHLHQKLKDIAAQKDALSLKESYGGRPVPRLPTTSLVDESEVCFREDVKDQILDFLNVFQPEDASKANLKGKKYLNELILKWATYDTHNATENGTHQYSVLEHLYIRKSCEDLISFPLGSFTRLQKLKLQDCKFLRSVGMPQDCHEDLKFLQKLKIKNCDDLGTFDARGLSSLQKLKIVQCLNLFTFGECGLPSGLQSISIRNCKNLPPQETWGLEGMGSLRHCVVD